MLNPFLRNNLDILFVGLNPAKTSSFKGHYFSTNSAFWNQLSAAGLILEHVDMNIADEKVFGSNEINYNNMQFGITDLVNYYAESNSSKVKPTDQNCIDLINTIRNYKPQVVVLLHKVVYKKLVKDCLNYDNEHYGNIGKIVPNCNSVFFNIPFPHGNNIRSEEKIKLYRELKEFLCTSKNTKPMY